LLALKSSNTTFRIDKQKQQQQTWEMCAIPHGHGAGFFSSFLAILLQQRRPERERKRRREKKTTKQMQQKA
jgi:hypothetical protein